MTRESKLKLLSSAAMIYSVSWNLLRWDGVPDFARSQAIIAMSNAGQIIQNLNYMDRDFEYEEWLDSEARRRDVA